VEAAFLVLLAVAVLCLPPEDASAEMEELAQALGLSR
jgi:hypothetical protein